MPQENEHEKLLLCELEGRVFAYDTPTFEQELFITAACTEAGLLDMSDLGGLKLDDSQNLPRTIQLLLVKAYQSGALFRLMSALLVEQGQDWTEKSAEANAEFFKHIRDPKSKEQLHPILVKAILAFFATGVNFATTSITSSMEEVGVVPRAPKLTPAQAEAVFRSGRMPSSSEASPITAGTGSRSTTSSNGKSATASSRSRKSSKTK